MATGAFGNPCIDGHSVMIHDRGGKRRIDQITDITYIKWPRLLNGQAIYQVTVSGKRECARQLTKLQAIKPRRHELVIFRGTERVAEGPIVRVKWYSDRVEIFAKDVTEYVAGASLSRDWPNSDGGGSPLMTERVRQILEWELTTPYVMRVGTGGAAHTVTIQRWENLTPPANVLPFLEVRASTTLQTTSSTEAFEMSVLDHLDDRARSALNYTTIGRKLLVWDSSQLLGKTRKLTDADFYGEIEVFEDGTGYSSIQHVSAQRGEADPDNPPAVGVTPGVGHDGDVDPYYGAWEYIGTMSSEEGESSPTEDALNSQAQRIDRARNSLPLVMNIPTSSGLRLGRDLTVDMLVPGTVMPVAATFNLRPVIQNQLLDSLSVEETPDGEMVQLSLIPAGDLQEVS